MLLQFFAEVAENSPTCPCSSLREIRVFHVFQVCDFVPASRTNSKPCLALAKSDGKSDDENRLCKFMRTVTTERKTGVNDKELDLGKTRQQNTLLSGSDDNVAADRPITSVDGVN